MLTGWMLESCVFRRKSRKYTEGRRRYKRLTWAADGQLQILRLALEKTGHVSWKNKLGDIPVRSPKDPSIQQDIGPSFEEPSTFNVQMRNLPRRTGDDMGVPVGYRAARDYSNVYGAQVPDQRVDHRPQPASAPRFHGGSWYVEDSAPLLHSR